jgi:hypothetical protein
MTLAFVLCSSWVYIMIRVVDVPVTRDSTVYYGGHCFTILIHLHSTVS